MPDTNNAANRSRTFARIASTLYDPGSILNEISQQQRPGKPEQSSSTPTKCQRLLTPIEAEVAQIWAEVLQLAHIDVVDDFFALGGNSLTATQVIARLRERFGVEIPLSLIFDGAFTVAELAIQVERHQIANAKEEVLEELLARVTTLSDDEADELLHQYGKGTSPNDAG